MQTHNKGRKKFFLNYFLLFTIFLLVLAPAVSAKLFLGIGEEGTGTLEIFKSIGKYVLKIGDTMTGNLNMFESNITFNTSITTYNTWTGQVNFTHTGLTNVTYINQSGYSTSIYDDGLIIYHNYNNVSSIGDNSTCVADISSRGISQGAKCTWSTGGLGDNTNFDMTTGRYAGSVHFNKNAGNIFISYGSQLNDQNIEAFSFWFKPDRPVNSSGPAMAFFSASSGYQTTLWTGSITSVLTNEVITLFFTNSSRTGIPYRVGICNSTLNFPANEWHHFMAAWNGTWYNLYIDGVQKDNCWNIASGGGTSVRLITAANPSIAGVSGSAGSNYTGYIDNFMLWNTSHSQFTSSDIQRLYSQSIDRINTTDWSFNTSDAGTSNDVCYGNETMTCFQTPIVTQYSSRIGFDGGNNITISSLAGIGISLACIDANGKLYRGNATSCG